MAEAITEGYFAAPFPGHAELGIGQLIRIIVGLVGGPDAAGVAAVHNQREGGDVPVVAAIRSAEAAAAVGARSASGLREAVHRSAVCPAAAATTWSAPVRARRCCMGTAARDRSRAMAASARSAPRWPSSPARGRTDSDTGFDTGLDTDWGIGLDIGWGIDLDIGWGIDLGTGLDTDTVRPADTVGYTSPRFAVAWTRRRASHTAHTGHRPPKRYSPLKGE